MAEAPEPALLTLTLTPLRNDPRARRAVDAARAADIRTACRSGHAPTGRGGRRRETARELRGVIRLLRLLRRTWSLLGGPTEELRPTLVHAHDLDTLPAAFVLARRYGARLVYDAHELYTGFDADPPRLWLAIVRRLEGALTRRAHAVVTVSDEIADRLVALHGLDRRPYVVLNAPPLSRLHVTERRGPLRAIYQSATGPGRHLGDLPSLPDVEISARVLGATAAPPHVRLLEPVPPDELVPALAEFDVGLVIDRAETENARLALPNKLFEYLMAGLAVVVPEAPAMASLVNREGVGRTFRPGRLGDVLKELAADRAAVEAMRRRARAVAVERYNAEAQRPALYAAWGL